MTNEKVKVLKKLVENTELQLERIKMIIADEMSGTDTDLSKISLEDSSQAITAGNIIEGVFDGQKMIGPDGKDYAIPANYASKSKLVEGDILKLTISSDGSFIYKQIKPIDRDRVRGTLARDEETNEFRVLVDNKLYKVLLASITYFKGKVGDQVVLLVPTEGTSAWAAVENIIPAGEELEDELGI